MNGLFDVVLGGARPSFDERFGAAPQQDPRIDDLIRAMAMRKMLTDGPQQGGGQWGAPIAPAPMPGGPPQWPRATEFSSADMAKPKPAAPVVAANPIPDFAPMGAPQPQAADDEFSSQKRSMEDMLPTGQQRGMNRMMSGLGAGMAQITGNTAGANFARGFGSAIQGATRRGDVDLDQHLKVLDRLKQAAESGDTQAYRRAQTDYLNLSNESIRREMANPNAAKPAAAQKTGVVERLVEQLRRENPDLTYAQALDLAKRGNQDIARENLAIRATRLNETDRYTDPEGTLEKNRERYGARPGTQKPAEKPMIDPPKKPISLPGGGDGTQASPYKPTSYEEWAKIPLGSYFVKPGDPPGYGRIKRTHVQQ